MTYIQLTYGDLVLSALLVVMDGALSLVLRLKLERQLAIATIRMVLQLVLVGYVLTFLFEAVSPLWTALAAFIMVLFASREIVARQKRRLRGRFRSLWLQAFRIGRHSEALISGATAIIISGQDHQPQPGCAP
jgi:putative ABC transport system permease protein